MNLPSIDDLVSAGVHFGHKSSRWNPKMEPFIFAQRSQVHVIDLEKTLEKLKEALEYVKELASKGGQILFVGTKRQAGEIVRKYAQEAGMPYVNVRWLGGTFTNFKTIQKTVRKLERLHKTSQAEDFEQKYTKKERLQILREIEKTEKLFEGIKEMKKLPEAVYVADIKHESIAVREANKSGVKVVGLVDTNSDPERVDYLIPGNDDAIKSIELVTRLISEAAREGQAAEQSTPPGKEDDQPGTTEAPNEQDAQKK